MNSTVLSTATDSLICDLLFVLDDILTERDVLLFALFLREDAVGKWDLLVSSRSFEVLTTLQAIECVVEKLRLKLRDSEFLQLSRIVIVSSDNPALPGVANVANVERGRCDIHDFVFSGVEVKHAIILRAVPVGPNQEGTKTC